MAYYVNANNNMIRSGRRSAERAAKQRRYILVLDLLHCLSQHMLKCDVHIVKHLFQQMYILADGDKFDPRLVGLNDFEYLK